MITTLRGMVAHKLRLALTTASIALGVAFLAGTLVLTDTMRVAFETDQIDLWDLDPYSAAQLVNEPQFDVLDGAELRRDCAANRTARRLAVDLAIAMVR